MKASTDWLTGSGVQFLPDDAYTGSAHLQAYTARFCVCGEGPPLILVPGLAGGFQLLGPLARCLAQHFRVITYQLRGEDDCFALRRQFGLEDLVEDLREFMDWLSLERPAVMGVSFGGVLGLELAARYPHRLHSLTVQGCGAKFEQGLVQQIAGMVLSHYPLPPDSPFVNQFFSLLFGGKVNKRGPLFQFVTRQCWQTDQSVMTHRFEMVRGFDITPRLKNIRVPSLVLSGGRDMLVSPRSLTALQAGLRDCRTVELPDCGHLAFVTRPDRVADEVELFLRQTGHSRM